MHSMMRWLQVTAGLLLLFTLGACAPAGGGTGASGSSGASAPGAQPAAAAPGREAFAPPLQALVDAARAEGQLTLTHATMDEPGEIPRLIEGFNRAYGLNLVVQFTPHVNMPELVNRLIQEHRASRTATTDVFVGTDSHIMQLLQADALETVDWQSWAPNVQSPELIAPNGVAVKQTTRASAITYNSDRLRGDMVPTSLQDLLKPQYKGRIATMIYAGAFANLGSPELWGEERILDYVTRLVDQVSGLVGCSDGERVVNGEFDAYAIDCATSQALRFQKRGAPLAAVIPSDAPLLTLAYVGVPRHAAHPNAAKLWINYLVSREAQDVIYEHEFGDQHLIPGSKTAQEIAELQARGIQFIQLDVEWSLRNEQTIRRLRPEIERILYKR
jgi:ABC-type Fe3+ transport system substrate-binding protein